jgi:hypothetical protein
MVKRKSVATMVVGVVCALALSASAITVTETGDANTLVNTILGPGVSVVGGTLNYVGAAVASGTFTGGGASGIGVNSGVILTSGKAGGAVGPNTSDGYTRANGLSGDADLNALVGGGTYDATVLEFDFISGTGDLFFNYVFASDEYNEYADTTFNDVFAFFLDGENIALIPGTTIPVAINNVNATLDDHPEYYNNNDMFGTGNPFPYNIQYDGFTDVFTAKKLGLTAGSHHIKLAIADRGDDILDSAVFIQAGTFSGTEHDIPDAGCTLALLGLAVSAMGTLRRFWM